MYAKHFGLSREPFSIAPDPHYLYMSERHREALAHLRYGLSGGGGFVVLTGEIGAGKTTVCRCLLEQVPPRCNVAYIFNPKLTVLELLRTVCDEFHITPEPPTPGLAPSVKDYIDPLNRFLLNTHATGRHNVLIIDEAQNLSADVLEQLRLLTNLETSERKLLQIILIGQPELRTMLARPEMEQLAQRVIARYHLEPLSEADTALYIHHRLRVGGLSGALPFDEGALQRIHQRSGGVPRRINLLCERALLGAYGSAKAQVDASMVDRAAAEVFGEARPDGRAATSVRAAGRSGRVWAGVAGGALCGAVLAWALMRPTGDGPAITASSRSAPPVGEPRASVVAGVGAAASAVLSTASSGTVTAAAPDPVVPTAEAIAPAPLPSAPVAVAAAASSSTVASAAVPSAPTPSAAAAAPAVAATSAGDTASASPAPARALMRDPEQAWRELAVLWGLAVPGGTPCREVVTHQLQCFSVDGSIELVRRLGRPGIVTLYDQDEQPVYALLTALGPDSATLRVGDVSQTISLRTLSRLWRGGFATYWRVPPGWSEGQVVSADGPAARWVQAQLERWEAATQPGAGGATERTLVERIAAFQRAQGLKPDGLAGPVTLMQLNRAAGVDEPRLGRQG